MSLFSISIEANAEIFLLFCVVFHSTNANLYIVHSSHKHFCAYRAQHATISFHFILFFQLYKWTYKLSKCQRTESTILWIWLWLCTHRLFRRASGAPFFHFVCFSQRNWNGTFAIPQQMYCVHKLEQINLKMSRKGKERRKNKRMNAHIFIHTEREIWQKVSLFSYGFRFFPFFRFEARVSFLLLQIKIVHVCVELVPYVDVIPWDRNSISSYLYIAELCRAPESFFVCCLSFVQIIIFSYLCVLAFIQRDFIFANTHSLAQRFHFAWFNHGSFSLSSLLWNVYFSLSPSFCVYMYAWLFANSFDKQFHAHSNTKSKQKPMTFPSGC